MTTYLEGVANLTAFLAGREMATAVEAITREHLEEWLIAMREAGRKRTTVAARSRSVQQFFKWAADEGLVTRSPMAMMRPPKIPETPPPVGPRIGMRFARIRNRKRTALSVGYSEVSRSDPTELRADRAG